MTFALLIIVFALCQVLEGALEYDAANDNEPDKLWHRIIHRLSDWLSSDEEAPQG